MKGYKSDDRKAIKQYVFILSFMKSLEEYYETNGLDKNRLYKYLLMTLMFFYLKLNYHVQNSLISAGEIMVIEQQMKTDKKLKKKLDEIQRTFYKILT